VGFRSGLSQLRVIKAVPRAHTRAEALFKKKEHFREGAKPVAEYKTAQEEIRDNTVRVGALRLARDVAKPSPRMRNTTEELMFRRYRRKQIAELRPYQPGESLHRISISDADRETGSLKPGDMIARNPKNHDDQWLVTAQYFADNFEPV
jgi:hypothetical protein